MPELNKCSICGEYMPLGEQMFKFHGYSGPCPKPPLLQPHQARVVAEKEELDTKLNALSHFIAGGLTFSSLDVDEQTRLRLQKDYMEQYSEVLGERIAAFKGKQ